MSPGMTVVPRQSTTAAAPRAPIRDAAPMAAILPFSTRIASTSARGDASIPVATAPMFTRPSVDTNSSSKSPPRPVTGRWAWRAGAVGVEGTRSRHATAGAARPDGAQPPRSSARVPRGPLDPGRARPPRPSACRPALGENDPEAATLVLPEATVDQIFGGVPVVGLEHSPVHDGLRRRVEHLVLELAASELGADEIPDELHELDALTRARSGRLVVAFRVGAGIRAGERGLRGRHGLESTARQLAKRAHHVHDQPALEPHARVDVLWVRPCNAAGDQGKALSGLHQRVERRAQRRDVTAERRLDSRIALRRLNLGESHRKAGHE